MISEKILVQYDPKYPLDGILTLPDSTDTPVPAVIFVHGSGSSNMDEKVGKLTPFKDLAEGLAEHGIASIRYDKRSFKHGMKMLSNRKLILTVEEETIQDAVAAAELARGDARIDPEKIFIIGHSMGGMLAPRIDAEGGNFRGLIIMAGSPRTLNEIMVGQLDEMLQEMNPILRILNSKKIEKLKHSFDGMEELSDAEAKRKSFGGGTTIYYFKEMNAHPVAEYLQNNQKPLFIMQGTKDFQVRIEKDYDLYRQILQDDEKASFKLYEGLNHCFVPSVYGKISKANQEYAVEQHIGKDVIADIAEWIFGVLN